MYFSWYFTWVGFIDIRMLILTRVFCVFFTLGSDWVYQYSRLTFGVGASLGDPAISILLSVIQLIPVMWSDLVFDYCIETSLYSWFLLYLVNSVIIYIVASWTTILLFPLHYCYITLCLWSVLILFTVYAEFCQI